MYLLINVERWWPSGKDVAPHALGIGQRAFPN